MRLLLSIVLLSQLLLLANCEENSLKKLHHDLFKNYDKLIRPVKDWKRTVTTNIGFTITRIKELNEAGQNLALDGWLSLGWTDEHLTWSPINYSGITLLRVDVDLLWKPDVMVYNGADIYENMKRRAKTQAILYSTGKVLWIPPVTLKTTCNFNLRRYPNDVQQCNMTLGSWTFDSKALNITMNSKGLLDPLHELSPLVTGDWELVANRSVREAKIYECCKDQIYPTVTLTLTFRRRSPMAGYTVVLPQALSFLMTLLSFLLPPKQLKGRLIITSLSIGLAFAPIYWIAGQIPRASSTPLAVICSGILSCLGFVAMILSLVSNFLSHRSLKVPTKCRWLQKYCPSSCPEKEALDGNGVAKEEPKAELAAACLDRLFFAGFLALGLLVHIVLMIF